MRRVTRLAAAITAVLERSAGSPDEPATDLASLREVTEGQARIRIVPVEPGHPREPRRNRFELDAPNGVCYVRQADWPQLQAALLARRAASAKASA